MVTAETSAMLQWFELYFATFPEREGVEHDELESLVRLRSGDAAPESVALTLHMVDQLRQPLAAGALEGILGQLLELDLSGRAAALITQYQNGAEVNLAYELQRMAADAGRAKGAANPADYIDTPIGAILAEVSDDRGIKFRRIAALRESVLGLQGGASIILAARPDKGKTSFIADAVTDFAPQCVQHFGGHRPILWLCNEGSGKRIVPRIYQAALAKDLDQIITMSNAGELEQAYAEAIGADARYIRVKDAHGMSLAQIEQVVEAMKPCIVVFDMLANIRTGKPSGGNKADEIETLAQGVREMGVIHDFISISTMQISQEGGNMLYPPYSALKDSKTAAQGACDVILMLGSLDDPQYQSLRAISTPKNKFQKPGKPSYVACDLQFNGSTCRFNDGSTPA